MNNVYSISIILNCHKEGRLLEKTIKNIKDIIQYTSNNQPNWVDIEIIAILDNADTETQKIIYNHRYLFAKIEEVNYKDLGLSRNHGINIAKNNFIVFADGDDYCSHNMLVAIYEKIRNHYSNLYIQSVIDLDLLDNNNHIAIFPEILIEFPNLYVQKYLDSNDFVVSNMRFTHLYISRICCYKSILLKNPLHTNQLPYSYEDWDLNNILLSKGIKYCVCNYIVYYRKIAKKNSLLNIALNNKCIVRNSDIYSSKFNVSINIKKNIQNIEIKKISKLKNKYYLYKEKLKYIAYKTSTLELCRKIKYRIDNTIKYGKILAKIIYLKFPALFLNKDHYLFLKKQKQFLHSYNEKKLNIKHKNCFGNFLYFANNASSLNNTYSIINDFINNCEVIFLVPWIKLGGADKVIMHSTSAIIPNYKVGVITTLESGNRINFVKTPTLNLSDIISWNNISLDDKLHIVLKSLINTPKLKIIHCINSELGYQLIQYYDSILKEYNIKIIISFFAPVYLPMKQVYAGYPVKYNTVFNKAHLVLSDNFFWYDKFKEFNSNCDFKFKKLFSPIEILPVSYTIKNILPKKILWASRICSEKLFSVFIQIVKKLPNYQFIVYGSLPEESYIKAIFSKISNLKNLEYRGEYRNINELKINEFDLFLYTSLIDGIPNVILEMVMLGIPIVTSNVGGIHEVLGDDYPLLVNNINNENNYIEKINLFFQDPLKIANKILSIREHVIKDYNEQRFNQEYNKIIDNLIHEV